MAASMRFSPAAPCRDLPTIRGEPRSMRDHLERPSLAAAVARPFHGRSLTRPRTERTIARRGGMSGGVGRKRRGPLMPRTQMRAHEPDFPPPATFSSGPDRI